MLERKIKLLIKILVCFFAGFLFEGLSAAAIETVLNESEAIRVQEGKDSIDGECIAKAALKCREKLNVRRK